MQFRRFSAWAVRADGEWYVRVALDLWSMSREFGWWHTLRLEERTYGPLGDQASAEASAVHFARWGWPKGGEVQ